MPKRPPHCLGYCTHAPEGTPEFPVTYNMICLGCRAVQLAADLSQARREAEETKALLADERRERREVAEWFHAVANLIDGAIGAYERKRRYEAQASEATVPLHEMRRQQIDALCEVREQIADLPGWCGTEGSTGALAKALDDNRRLREACVNLASPSLVEVTAERDTLQQKNDEALAVLVKGAPDSDTARADLVTAAHVVTGDLKSIASGRDFWKRECESAWSRAIDAAAEWLRGRHSGSYAVLADQMVRQVKPGRHLPRE